MPSQEVPSHEPRHILIVDDEQPIRTLLREVLSLRGYHITTAADGYEALARLWEQRYDLVILDLLMPGLSGADVARTIMQTFQETPIVVVTGSDAATIEEKLGDTPVSAIVPKPFPIARILQVVTDLIGAA